MLTSKIVGMDIFFSNRVGIEILCINSYERCRVKM